MSTMDWTQVTDTSDPYFEEGDTHYVDGRDWVYYWNQDRRVIRRFGKRDHAYQEVSYRSRPHTEGAQSLPVLLGAIFHRKQR